MSWAVRTSSLARHLLQLPASSTSITAGKPSARTTPTTKPCQHLSVPAAPAPPSPPASTHPCPLCSSHHGQRCQRCRAGGPPGARGDGAAGVRRPGPLPSHHQRLPCSRGHQPPHGASPVVVVVCGGGGGGYLRCCRQPTPQGGAAAGTRAARAPPRLLPPPALRCAAAAASMLLPGQSSSPVRRWGSVGPTPPCCGCGACPLGAKL